LLRPLARPLDGRCELDARSGDTGGEYDGSMTPVRASALSTVTALGAAALLAACGSGTKTVTAASAPPVPPTATTAPTTTTQKSTTATKPTTTTSPTTSTGSSTARSAPEPAFAQQEGKPEGTSAAAAAVRERGYTPNDTAEYHADQTLRVLVGTRTGSADGYGQQAFFFVDGRYLGTDAKEPSAKVKVVGQGDTEVTLAYALYRRGDPLSSPSGGEARVTFQLNNGKLVPLGKIPPASSTAALSRQ
jgi:LppP/LprE lipoprotein